MPITMNLNRRFNVFRSAVVTQSNLGDNLVTVMDERDCDQNSCSVEKATITLRQDKYDYRENLFFPA